MPDCLCTLTLNMKPMRRLASPTSDYTFPAGLLLLRTDYDQRGISDALEGAAQPSLKR